MHPLVLISLVVVVPIFWGPPILDLIGMNYAPYVNGPNGPIKKDRGAIPQPPFNPSQEGAGSSPDAAKHSEESIG